MNAYARHDYDTRSIILWFLLSVLVVIALSGCAAPGPKVPTIVKVPVPVECNIEQVPVLEKPQATSNMGLFDLAKVALAQLRTVEAENERLRAANANPCPAPK